MILLVKKFKVISSRSGILIRIIKKNLKSRKEIIQILKLNKIYYYFEESIHKGSGYNNSQCIMRFI